MSDTPFTTHGNEPVEARIVSWVLGEASAFEAAELKRLCDEQPELEIFRRRIEALHGMLGEAANPKDDAEWKLSAEKRKPIERLLGAASSASQESRIRQSGRRTLWAIAACLVLTVVVAQLMGGLFMIRSGEVRDFPSVILYESPSEKEMVPFSAVADINLPAELIEGTPKPMNVPGLVDHSDRIRRLVEGKRQNAAREAAQVDPFAGALDDARREDVRLKRRVVAPTAKAKSKASHNVARNRADGQKLGLSGNLAGGDASANYAFRGSELSDADAAPAESEDQIRKPAASVSEVRTSGQSWSASGIAVPVPDLDFDGAIDFGKGSWKRDATKDERMARSRHAGAVELKTDAPADEAVWEKAKDDYYRAAHDSTRAALLMSADAAWELSAPEGGNTRNGLAALSHRVELDRGSAEVEPFADSLDEVAQEEMPEPKVVPVLDEVAAAQEPYSTFSLNVSDSSFLIAQAALAKGEQPDPAGIQVEHFYNAVDYNDPAPAANQPVAGIVEQAAHPVIPGRNLVRIAVKTAAAGRAPEQPLHLTLLLDQSGSMGREDRREAMDKALVGLTALLTPNDLVSVIGFARTPHLLVDGLNGRQGKMLRDLMNQEASEGGTNLEEAIVLGEQLAMRYHEKGAQNRIVLFTDGAANLGDADPESLARRVKSLRQNGIAFDIAGIAADGLNDELLGELARNGNGRYYVVGKGAGDAFAKQLAGAFRPAAENVKVQVHFNPARVGRYKLVGFEKDRLKKEDFRNDAVDAAELAAEEAGVAIYQVEPLVEGEGEIGEVSVRFRDTASGQMVERTWAIPYDPSAPTIERATPSMQLVTLAMFVGEKLKGGPLADAIDFNHLKDAQANVRQNFGATGRVGDLLQMLEALK